VKLRPFATRTSFATFIEWAGSSWGLRAASSTTRQRPWRASPADSATLLAQPVATYCQFHALGQLTARANPLRVAPYLIHQSSHGTRVPAGEIVRREHLALYLRRHPRTS
jgi:hypothetical protein